MINKLRSENDFKYLNFATKHNSFAAVVKRKKKVSQKLKYKKAYSWRRPVKCERQWMADTMLLKLARDDILMLWHALFINVDCSPVLTGTVWNEFWLQGGFLASTIHWKTSPDYSDHSQQSLNWYKTQKFICGRSMQKVISFLHAKLTRQRLLGGFAR